MVHILLSAYEQYKLIVAKSYHQFDMEADFNAVVAKFLTFKTKENFIEVVAAVAKASYQYDLVMSERILNRTEPFVLNPTISFAEKRYKTIVRNPEKLLQFLFFLHAKTKNSFEICEQDLQDFFTEKYPIFTEYPEQKEDCYIYGAFYQGKRYFSYKPKYKHQFHRNTH